MIFRSRTKTRFRKLCLNSKRRGTATLEEVMILCVAIPTAALLMYVGIKIVFAISDIMFILVGAPFM